VGFDIVHIVRDLSGFVLQLLPGVSFSLQGFDALAMIGYVA
jgi:hypothetical protein